jgi:hypothetical protein
MKSSTDRRRSEDWEQDNNQASDGEDQHG